jgi:hypothetical protein
MTDSNAPQEGRRRPSSGRLTPAEIKAAKRARAQRRAAQAEAVKAEGESKSERSGD